MAKAPRNKVYSPITVYANALAVSFLVDSPNLLILGHKSMTETHSAKTGFIEFGCYVSLSII